MSSSSAFAYLRFHALPLGATALLWTGAAFAQDKNGDVASNAPPVPQPATTTALPDSSSAPAPDRFKRFDDLSLKGWDIPYPKVADTILADHWGISRSCNDLLTPLEG